VLSEYHSDGVVTDPATTPDPVPTPPPPAAGRSILNPRVLGAAALAAVTGAAGWMLMVVTTDYEIGFAAVGLGILSAFLVGQASGGRRSFGLVALALVAFVAALAIGKYAAFGYFLHQEAEQRFGAEFASHYGYLSPDTWTVFREDPGAVFGGFDLLWIGIGALSIWRRLAPTVAPRPQA
jgi:hypothetical protein